MNTFLQALIMSFREGLEAFLIVAILLKYTAKIKQSYLKKHIWNGVIFGVICSLFFGGFLQWISGFIGNLKTTAKLWESIAGFVAVGLVITFLIWMIKHGKNLKHQLENDAAKNLTKKGIFLLSAIFVAREGAEIAVFSFAGKYEVLPVITGLGLSIILAILIHYSLVKVQLQTIFNITLFYLIIQAGYLFGYSIHEGISALKDLELLSKDSAIYGKAFNLSETIFNHKEGLLGVPLNVFLGWYSKPEWIQFVSQYGLTAVLINYWRIKNK